MRWNRLKHSILMALVAVGMLTSSAMAASAWTPWATPTKVYSGYADGKVYIGGLANVGSCSSTLVKVTTADSDPTKLLTLTLSAKLSGKRMSCIVNGCDGKYQRGRQCRLE